MTKKHTPNKFFAEIRAELPKDYQQKVADICKSHDLDPLVMTKKDIVLKIIDVAVSNDGVENPSKEEWLKSIQNNPPYEDIQQVIASEIRENCHYHAEDKDQWYCETKKIPCAVCIQQYKRYRAMNRRCRPLHKPRTKVSTKVNVANFYERSPIAEEKKLEEEKGYYCYLKGKRFKELSELPCLKNSMTRCQNTKCEENILSQIKR